MVAPFRLSAIVRGFARGVDGRIQPLRLDDGQGDLLAAGGKGGGSASYRPLLRRAHDQNPSVCDAFGRAIAIAVTPGHLGDVRAAAQFLGQLPPSRRCAADTAYDSDALSQLLHARGTKHVIPKNPTRKRTHPFDRKACMLRNLVELAFWRLKDLRTVAT